MYIEVTVITMVSVQVNVSVTFSWFLTKTYLYTCQKSKIEIDEREYIQDFVIDT